MALYGVGQHLSGLSLEPERGLCNIRFAIAAAPGTIRGMLSRLFALLTCILFTACGSIDYDAAPEGEFTGALLVMWVDEGDRQGDGRFVFVPSPNAPLTFTRKNPDATITEITPEMMYTDGGSIPRAATLFNGFSPWGYAPAYMVHDWIFVARHCLTDGVPTEAERAVAAMSFVERAQIIAEAIKTLIATDRVQPNDVAPRVISGTVAGPVSYNRWVVEGACAEDRVSETHRRQVQAALARRAGLRALRLTDQPAEIVSEINF
jgi:hypothetical protein